jgi:hypothetical protein
MTRSDCLAEKTMALYTSDQKYMGARG